MRWRAYGDGKIQIRGDSMRIMGIDFGDARVGVAVTDPLGITTQGVGTVKNGGIKKLLRNVEIDDLILIGIGILLLLDSDTDNDTLVLLILLMLFF